jgi:hypothetical protein
MSALDADMLVAQLFDDAPSGDGGGAVSITYDYEQDIRPRLQEMSRVISLDELRAFLGQFGAAKAPELKPEQFADVMAESGKLIERKAEQAAERDRLAAELEAERQAEEERLAAEAAERAAVAAAARAEQQRLENERMRAAMAERAEKERLAKAERDRLAAEKAKAEKARKDTERAAKAEQARLEKERLAKEQAEQNALEAEKAKLRAAQLARDLPYEVAANRQRGVSLVEKVQWLEQIAGHKQLHGAELKICIVLALTYFNSKRGRAWPSRLTLAKATGLNLRTVAKVIDKLDTLGIVIKQGGHTGKANYYIPSFVPDDITTTSNINELEALTTSAPQGTTPVPYRALPLCPTGHPNPSTNPRSNQRSGVSSGGAATAGALPDGRAAASDAKGTDGASSSNPAGHNETARAAAVAAETFPRFWQAYPKKEHRKSAMIAYAETIARGVTPGLLLDAAKRYAAAVVYRKPERIRYANNWLREEAYLDEPEPPKPAAEKKPASPKREAKRKGKATSKKKGRDKIKGDTRVLGVAWHEDWGKVALLSRVTSSPVRVVTRHGVRRDTPAGSLSQFDMRSMRYDDVVHWLD